MINILERVNTLLSGIVVPFLLIISGIFIGARLGFFHILHPIKVIKGLKNEKSDGISSAKAVSLALAGTLGVGNIVGVSGAIALGGFGAIFWMWISAVIAMILKYAEIVLAMRHRRSDSDGSVGGAAYYIYDLLRLRGYDRFASVLSTIFCTLFIITSLTMGSMLQASAIKDAVTLSLDIPPLITGLILVTMTLITARKGTRSITALTNYLVPIMTLAYISFAVAVIIIDRGKLSHAFTLIFSDAFTPSATVSGIGGFIFTKALRFGVMRGLVSNEAGCGTAPSAHSVAECNSPARQGLWGILEVFTDTVVLCTLTALVVVLEYDVAADCKENFLLMTARAFSSALGGISEYFLCIAVICFGFATLVCWWHYGMSCVKFLSNSRSAKILFGTAYCICIAVGTVSSSEAAWQLSDLSMGAMTVINTCILLIASGEVKHETLIFSGYADTNR